MRIIRGRRRGHGNPVALRLRGWTKPLLVFDTESTCADFLGISREEVLKQLLGLEVRVSGTRLERYTGILPYYHKRKYRLRGEPLLALGYREEWHNEAGWRAE